MEMMMTLLKNNWRTKYQQTNSKQIMSRYTVLRDKTVKLRFYNKIFVVYTRIYKPVIWRGSCKGELLFL